MTKLKWHMYFHWSTQIIMQIFSSNCKESFTRFKTIAIDDGRIISLLFLSILIDKLFNNISNEFLSISELKNNNKQVEIITIQKNL